MEFFETKEDALAFVFSELIATLTDDLEMSALEDDEADVMKRKISDITNLERFVMLNPTAILVG